MYLIKTYDLQRENTKLSIPKGGHPAQADKSLLVNPGAQNRKAETHLWTLWQEWGPLLKTLSLQWGSALQRVGHRARMFHLLEHLGTAKETLLHSERDSLLARGIM